MGMTASEIQTIPLESCQDHAGSPVCVVLKDGTHYYGILNGLEDGKLLLHNPVRGPGTISVSTARAKGELKTKASAARRKEGTKAGTSAFFAAPLAIDAALVALLFTLPFFFV